MRRIHQINNSIERITARKKTEIKLHRCARTSVVSLFYVSAVCTMQFAVSASRQFISNQQNKTNRTKSIHGVAGDTVLHA